MSLSVALFPGQGVSAQQIADALPADDDYLAIADEILGYPLRKRIATASRSKGSKLPTQLAQPGIFVASCVAWRRAEEEGARFDFIAGHSLGEYAALVAGRSFSFKQGLRAVVARANAMHEAARRAPGGMAALLGLGFAEVEDIAERSGVVVANDNAPGQVVVSGPEEALVRAARYASSHGGRSVLLDVSGPFHSEAMIPAAPAVRDALGGVDVRSPAVPVVANLTARPYRAPGEIRRLLEEQVFSPIRWRESLEWLWDQGVRDFVDLGPGQVVAGLARRTFRTLEVAHA